MVRAASEQKSASTSTGPRTPEGKARSSMNSLKHGLTAKAALIPGEDPEVFGTFVDDVICDLEAEGPVQQDLARRAAILMWKRRRLEQAEAQVIQELARNYIVEGEEEGEQEDGAEEAEDGAEDPDDVEIPVDPADPLKMARFITADEFAGKEGQLARLEQYDRRLGQQFDSTVRLLMKLQNRKQYQEQLARTEEQRRAASEQPGPAPAPGPAPTPEPAPSEPMEPPRAAAPPPPVPAQNELPPKLAPAAETGPPASAPR